MPVLTVDQVVEAILELPKEEQAEVIEQIREDVYQWSLTAKQKDITHAEIADDDCALDK